MHSLCSTCGKTSLTPCITAYPQSVQNVRPGGVPIASFNLSINQTQFSFVLESMTPIATRYIQLCASTAQVMHSWSLNFQHKKVLSTAKYGLQPLRKPSTHGFRAKKTIKPNLMHRFRGYSDPCLLPHAVLLLEQELGSTVQYGCQAWVQC